MIARNSKDIVTMLDDIDQQAQGYDAQMLTDLIDSIEVATRLARTEIYRSCRGNNFQVRRS